MLTGHWALFIVSQRYEDAAKAVERSIALCRTMRTVTDCWPSSTITWGAQRHPPNHQATALNPHYTYDYPELGMGKLYSERYPEAVVAKQALSGNENTPFPRLYLAASYVALGKRDDAIWEIEQLRVIAPDTTLSQVAKTSAVANPESLKRLLTQLREAGLPE
jgi:hypothetical protein